VSRPTNAALLSALVVPGAGHLYLKHFSRGIALVAISLACLGVLADRALQQASTLLGRLTSGDAAADPAQLADLIAQASNSPGSPAVTAASLVLAVCWAIGIVDAYRIARNQQKLNAPPRRPVKP